jgi:hypothetical protein
LVQWHEHRSQVRVCNAETSIHQRLRSALVQGGIHTSTLFDRLDSTDRQLRTEYGVIWHLALLAGKPLGQYRPSIGRLYQQQSSSPAAAASDVTPPETVWRYVYHKTLMPKMRSLLWTIDANAYWTAAKLATFTSVSPVCPQYGQHTETMAHALIDCQSVRPFWANVLSFISGQVDPMPDADAILQPRLPTDMHTHRSTKPVLLALACDLWVVHRTRIRRIYTDASSSVHFLTAEWRSMIKVIVIWHASHLFGEC